MSESKIRVLSDHTINKIAAGEVIENPASVVKELVENAIDAGSTEICIEIMLGGRQLIRISDNGCGMSRDDAILCLERHATSKIREVEDIQNLFTMGFRGEAIPSIAAISKFTLLTCTGSEGTHIYIEGGNILSCSSAVRSVGTTIEVKSLFFNVPVRRKFQRSPNYDAQEIIKMASALALGHPSVHFELISDQKMIFKTPVISAESTFQERLLAKIECLHGKEIASQLTPLSFSHPPYKLEGFIGAPSFHRPNRTGQFLFINQRAVHSPLISIAIREGYGSMLGTNRFPLFMLHLHLPGSLLDVNVHPQKKEVRLREGPKLKDALIQAVQGALQKEESCFEVYEKSQASEAYPDSFRFSHSPHFQVSEEEWEFKENKSNTLDPGIDAPSIFLPASLIRREVPTYAESSPSLFNSAPKKMIPRVSLTISNYLIMDPLSIAFDQIPFLSRLERGGLCIINQQSAYARICYENLLKKEEEPQLLQSLLIPITLQLSPLEGKLMREHLHYINKLGFSLREFGEDAFILDALPPFIKEEKIESCLMEILNELFENEESRHLQNKKEERLAVAACRAALPKTKRLEKDEAQKLVDRLFACDNSYRCPMGAPIFACISLEELSRYFS
ncbi:MAG: DNA mismatch repair endonuclease MutL [Candidatus Protochlamydia sp.]|nr:DNA mismatch repair endonuclease MutL [Candidatus Protochlamydia sp.]